MPTDQTITLTGNNSVAWNAALAVSAPDTFTGYQWYLDGVAVANTTNSITLAAKSLRLGQHRLTLEVSVASDAIYSKTLDFTVTQVTVGQ